MVIGLKEHVPYYQIFLVFLTISSLNLVNYVWDAFAVLSVAENVLINQSKPTLDMLLKSPFIYDGMLQLHL